MNDYETKSNSIMSNFFTILICFIISVFTLLLTCHTFSSATKYCPLRHKLFFDCQCRFLSITPDGRTLVTHFWNEPSTEVMSIHHNDTTTWIEHPRNYTDYWLKDTTDKRIIITLDPDSKDSLIINNEKIPIVYK